MKPSITNLLLNQERTENHFDVERVLSVELDTLLSSVAAAVDVESDRLRPQTITQAPLHCPSLAELRTGWGEAFAKSLSSQLKCEVWLVEFGPSGNRSRTTGSDSNEHPNAIDQVVAIALDGVRAQHPIGSSLLGTGERVSPIADNAVRDRRIHSAWCTSLELKSLASVLSIVCLWKDEPTECAKGILQAIPLSDQNELISNYESWRFLELGERKWRRRKVLDWLTHRQLPSALLALVGLIGIMAIPCPYRPKRDCVLEAAARHYVSSPMEGKLVKTLVRPGEEVRQGQVLAQMEDGQLRREIAASEAELEGASKKRDIALAGSAWGDLRLARLECQQMELKLETLRERLGRLEILSPADGVVVQGDWFGNDGMPITFGQSLFEIASLETMVVEVHLKPEDLPWIEVGTKSILRTESTGSSSWVGRIQRIEPRAEIINDQAVLVAEMEVENPDWLFRPGMKGEAVVNTGYHSIGWILFHKPMRWLRNQWIW